MALQEPSPAVTLDNSPAESFMSTPGDFSSLFAPNSPSDTSPSTMNPMDMMTPQSSSDDKSRLSAIPEDEEAAPNSDKKSSKKRKSWGQVLPEPKTNLPPRKRAKTDDEKEQRRVERVLRNRRAAQSSRERKRLEVEALEERNKELEDLLNSARQANLMLVEELNRCRRDSGVVTRTSSSLDSMRDNITLSQQLFGAHGDLKAGSEQSGSSLIDDLVMSPANPTVNPASLSPELGPVPDLTNNESERSSSQEDSTTSKAQSTDAASAPSSDLAQYPAEILADLQCHMSEETAKPLLASQTLMSPLLALTLQLRMWLLSASAILSACQRPLTQIAMSSKAGFSLLPSPHILTTIIWLVTLPPASPTTPDSNSSTSTTSSTTKRTMSLQTLWQRATTPLRTTTASSRKSTTLRLKSLRKILSSSPNLARPLSDATMVALRLVSEGRDDRVGHLRNGPRATREVDSELTKCLSSIALPSKEVLMTLLWALKVEERRIRIRQDSDIAATVRPVGSVSEDNYVPTEKYELKIAGMKRNRQDASETRKRNRLA